MPYYFLLHLPDLLERSLLPTFIRSWQERSFKPLSEVAIQLRPGMAAYKQKYCLGEDEPVLERLIRGLEFDRDIWEMAFGEALFYGAVGAPDAPVSFTSLQCLLGSAPDGNYHLPRAEWHWIDRAVLGSRTFRLGRAVYRPYEAGWSNLEESNSLTEKLQEVDPAGWTIRPLAQLDPGWDEEDLEDELKLAHEALSGLCHIYEQAHLGGYAVVCEFIG